MTNNIEYQLGRIMCKRGTMHVREGLITDPEQIANAYDSLKIARFYPGGVEWIGDDSGWTVPTEEKADEILNYLSEEFRSQLIFYGNRPLDCAHGHIFFRKIAQLKLTSEMEEDVQQGVAGVLEAEPKDISRLIHGWR